MKAYGYSTYLRGGADAYNIGPPELFHRSPFAAICDPLALPGMEVTAFSGEFVEEVRIGRLSVVRLQDIRPQGVMISSRALQRAGITDPINMVAVHASTRSCPPSRPEPGSLEYFYRAIRTGWRRLRLLPITQPTLYRDILRTADLLRDTFYAKWATNPATVDWALAAEGANARWLGVGDRSVAAILSLGPILRREEAPYALLGLSPAIGVVKRVERLHGALLALDKEENQAVQEAKAKLTLSAISGEDAWKYSQLIGLDPGEGKRAARTSERLLIRQAAADHADVRMKRGRWPGKKTKKPACGPGPE